MVRDEWVVLKEATGEMVERFEPGVGEAMRGVWYWEAVGERREEGWLVRVGVVGDARGFEGLGGWC